MEQCKYFEICGLPGDKDPNEKLCLLHAKAPGKTGEAFWKLFEDHRRIKGDDFRFFVFPDFARCGAATFNNEANFGGAIFTQGADFGEAIFTKAADFGGAIFSGRAHFGRATFNKEAYFRGTTFTKPADFAVATFIGRAYFGRATFNNEANFRGATFSDQADFEGATFTNLAKFWLVTFRERAKFGEVIFSERADFREATFSGRGNFGEAIFSERAEFGRATFSNEANFRGAAFSDQAGFEGASFDLGAYFGEATFLSGALFQGTLFDGGLFSFESSTFNGRTLFTSRPKEEPKEGEEAEGKPDEKAIIKILSGAKEVNFKSVNLDLADSIIFREADLQRCLFQDTNLQKVQFTGVKWHDFDGRDGVYDETFLKKGESGPWDRVERLYRELKKNHEDNRDYERAGHFHYGEKEMRRKNPNTSPFLKLLLSLYLWFSGYGESVVRPLFWTVGLLAVSTIGYLWLGLFPVGGKQLLSWNNFSDWLAASLYSLRVIFFLKPDDMILAGLGAKALHTAQSILGPLFIALLALAVRQKLKR